jgi:hypothetical protein
MEKFYTNTADSAKLEMSVAGIEETAGMRPMLEFEHGVC